MVAVVNNDLLSPRLLYYYMGDFCVSLWDKYKSVILGLRERYDEPPKGMFLEFFETLVLALKKERLNDRVDFQRRLEMRRLAWGSVKEAPVP